MKSEQRLERMDIEQREIERYPDERIAEIPSGYLDAVEDYIDGDEESSDLLERAVDYERERRERKELRLHDVPTAEDLFRIKKRADQRKLYEEKSRRMMADERKEELPTFLEMDETVLRQHAGDEVDVRRSHRFMEYLDTEYADDSLRSNAPFQQKVEDGIGLYLFVSNSEVKGIKYGTDGMADPEVAWRLESLAEEAAETQRKLEEEPERIGGFGDLTFFNLAKKHADLLEASGEDVDKNEMIGYGIEDLGEKMEHLMDESAEALRTLRKIGVTYFEIEGFHTEEVASLVDHLSVRDGFEVERISTYTDTDMNSGEWKSYHEKRIREDTDEDNALRMFLDDE